jgi:hypothetical protein
VITEWPRQWIDTSRLGEHSMNDEQDFRDQVGTHGTPRGNVAGYHTRRQGRWVETLSHRWPTALGIALAVLIFFDAEVNVEFVSVVSTIVILIAFIYVGAAALNRRRAAWELFVAGCAILTAGRLLDSSIGASVVFLVSALVFVMLGVVRGHMRNDGGLPLQTIGMLGFSAIGLLALPVNPTLGGYLVAAALIGHAVWDAVHFRRNQVVTRSYAEFCAVLDVLLGGAILVLLAMR